MSERSDRIRAGIELDVFLQGAPSNDKHDWRFGAPEPLLEEGHKLPTNTPRNSTLVQPQDIHDAPDLLAAHPDALDPDLPLPVDPEAAVAQQCEMLIHRYTAVLGSWKLTEEIALRLGITPLACRERYRANVRRLLNLQPPAATLLGVCVICDDAPEGVPQALHIYR